MNQQALSSPICSVAEHFRDDFKHSAFAPTKVEVQGEFDAKDVKQACLAFALDLA